MGNTDNPFEVEEEHGTWTVDQDEEVPGMVRFTTIEGKKSVIYLPPMDALEVAQALVTHATDTLGH